jgi:hypothetical protein
MSILFWHYGCGWWSDGGQHVRPGNRHRLRCGVWCIRRCGVYVATAVNISRLKLVGYFITSFIFGVIGAPLLGSYFSKWTGYSDRPLDALGAVIVAAIAIKLLTFVNSQDLGSLFGILSRLRGGGASNGNK